MKPKTIKLLVQGSMFAWADRIASSEAKDAEMKA
jgi:hypothetical protein